MRVSFCPIVLLACRAGSRLHCRDAMRPGYEGVAKRRETRGLRGPGVLRTPRHACERATSPCDRGSAPLGAPLRWLSAYRDRACVLPAQKPAGSRSASSSRTGRVIARVAGSRAPGSPVDETEPAGTASCSICRSSSGRRPSASRTGCVYTVSRIFVKYKARIIWQAAAVPPVPLAGRAKRIVAPAAATSGWAAR
jgi:hypothetical protein